MFNRRSAISTIFGAATTPALRGAKHARSEPYPPKRPVPLELPRDIYKDLRATFVGSPDKSLTDAVHAAMTAHFADDPRIALFRFYNSFTCGENIQVRSSEPRRLREEDGK